MANIWVYIGGFRNVVRSYEDGVSTCEVAHVCLEVVSQLLSQLRNFRTAWCSCFQTAITSSFQIQFVYRLKRWTSNFSSFETKYSMHEMDSIKYSKYVQQLLSSWILHVRFLCFSSLHSWFAFGKGLQSSKAWIIHVNELPFALPWII